MLISHKDNKKLILTWLFNTNICIIEKLMDIYNKLQNFADKTWDTYTDKLFFRFENSNKVNIGLVG